MIKVDYTSKEWEARENYYLDILSKLTIPEDPTPKQLLLMLSQLDRLYTEASFEYATLRRKESRISLDLKNAEAKCFVELKKKELSSGNKITENDVKGLVKEYLSKNVIHPYTRDLYTLIKSIMDRFLFIEQTLKTLSEKKSSVMSSIGLLKIESGYAGTKDLKEEVS